MSAAVELLRTTVQHYDWGSTSAIPEMLGTEPDGRPHAELWIGAHPQAPSTLAATGARLDDLVAGDRDGQLGAGVAARYDRFPFLLKVLAADRPLSLQAHPSAAQAAAGFAREERDGPARDAPDRSYRDDWPKPEIACAVTPFEVLSGFRPLVAAAPVLRALERGTRHRGADEPGALLLTELVTSLLDPPGDAGAAPDEPGRLAVALRVLLSLDRRDAAAVAAAAVRAADAARADPATPGAVLAELDLLGSVAAAHPGDAGVVVALLLHHIRLDPGQAVYTPAGVLHAYLSGTAVELMASSDNVLRGGLTSKHVDVAQLLGVLDTTPAPPRLVDPLRVSPAEFDYPTPTPYFRLSRIELAPGESTELAPVEGPQLLLCAAGSVDVVELEAADAGGTRLGPGTAGYLRAGSGPLRLAAPGGLTTLYRARVGEPA